MNALVAMPLEVRLGALFVVGACAGSLINWGVYRLAYCQRSISPWSCPHPQAAPRRWSDRLPIAGWLGLRRESPLHGPGFWIRPLAVEVIVGLGYAALYWWEVDQQGLLFGGRVLAAPAPQTLTMLHAQCACHLLLASLMLVCSLIDTDEKTIPDAVIVPGTLFGLLAAMLYPWVLLPVPVSQIHNGRDGFDFLRLSTPIHWPAALDGAWGLVLALGCWWLWCGALMPSTWYGRHGWRRALRLCLARLARSLNTWLIAAMGAVGSIVIVAAWRWGAPHWDALLTSLVGMAAGAGIVWIVRIVGSAVLQREAMGFGDVTLMSMIGAMLGWQAALIVFILAPFAGIVIGLALYISRRENEIAFGPYLCLAALVAIVRWTTFWDRTAPSFALGLLIPVGFLVCVVAMGMMLAVWQGIKRLFG